LASDSPITQNDKRAIQALLWALKSLTNLRASMPLPCVTTFLMVALDEGKGVCVAQEMFQQIGRASRSHQRRIAPPIEPRTAAAA
jgi:hypothetical protein